MPEKNWPLTTTNMQRLQLNDRVMICSIEPEDAATVRSSELLAKLELEDPDLILGESQRLRWFGRVERLVVQSEQHVIYSLMINVGQGGPSFHGRN